MTALLTGVLPAFITEMLEKTLERIARRYMRSFVFVLGIGGFGGLDLDRYDRAADVVDNVGERHRGYGLGYFALNRGGSRLAQTAVAHASQGQGSDSAQERGTDFVAPAHDQRRRLRAIGPARLVISHWFLHFEIRDGKPSVANNMGVLRLHRHFGCMKIS